MNTEFEDFMLLFFGVAEKIYVAVWRREKFVKPCMIVEVLQGPPDLQGKKYIVPKGRTAWNFMEKEVCEDFFRRGYGRAVIHPIYIDKDIME